MDYLLGDIQGCCDALDHVLAEIGFSPSRDRLVVVGDLVNRGPASLQTLRRLHALGDAATCLLGNHDLHLLAVAAGVRPMHASDTFGDILASPEHARGSVGSLVAWPSGSTIGCVHAGVVPQWSAEQTLALAAEVEVLLAGPDLHDFLVRMYGNDPARWSDELRAADRWRFVINVLTRIRFCTDDGMLELKTKGGHAQRRPGSAVVRRRAVPPAPIAFGHWSTLGQVTMACWR
jgi:bis(5'-nucleosyl)-tetraphosphatase (symmetrical)